MRSLRVVFAVAVPFAALALGLMDCESDDSRYPASFTAPDATVSDGAKPDGGGDTGSTEDTGAAADTGSTGSEAGGDGATE